MKKTKDFGNPAKTGRIFTDESAYVKKCSNTLKKKIEKHIAFSTFRSEAISNLRSYQGNTVKQTIEGKDIDVLFDSKTTSHISNDITNSKDFLMKELSVNLPEILERSKLVAHEPNAKLDKKPWALEYFYYEYKTKWDKCYLCVEENFVSIKNRHYYRLYSIVKQLRDTAILYDENR